jgi:hypothetical protein
MILATWLISCFAVVASALSVWLSRISYKISKGRRLSRPERWVTAKLTASG